MKPLTTNVWSFFIIECNYFLFGKCANSPKLSSFYFFAAFFGMGEKKESVVFEDLAWNKPKLCTVNNVFYRKKKKFYTGKTTTTFLVFY